MGIAIAIALGALFAAIAPLFAMWMNFKQQGEQAGTRDQRERIRELESQLSQCRDENLRIMRQLLRLNETQ